MTFRDEFLSRARIAYNRRALEKTLDLRNRFLIEDAASAEAAERLLESVRREAAALVAGAEQRLREVA